MNTQSTRRPSSMNTQNTAFLTGDHPTSGDPTRNLKFRHVQPFRYPHGNTALSSTNPFRSLPDQPPMSHLLGFTATANPSQMNSSGGPDGSSRYHQYSYGPVNSQDGAAVRHGSTNPYHARLNGSSRYSDFFIARYGPGREGSLRNDTLSNADEINNGYDAGESNDGSIMTNPFASPSPAELPCVDLEAQQEDLPRDKSYLLSDSEEEESDTTEESYPPLSKLLTPDHYQNLHRNQVNQRSVQAHHFRSPSFDKLLWELESTIHQLDESLRAQQDMSWRVESLERQLHDSQTSVRLLTDERDRLDVRCSEKNGYIHVLEGQGRMLAKAQEEIRSLKSENERLRAKNATLESQVTTSADTATEEVL